MKRCRNKDCPLPQPLKPEQFNKRADGLQPYCRVCQSMSNAKTYMKRTYTRPPNNTDHKRAHQHLRYRISTGEIKRGPCEVCNTPYNPELTQPNIKAFLPTLTRPLKPRWFCTLHHPRRSGNKE